ncbi:MAG TPA: hypothetical protein VHN79_13365 [Lacunisphaera sp.]|nr:hypothetical protein [Lacunisphaera sp.]
MKRLSSACLLLLAVAVVLPASASWTADNGNGTFTNPLFYAYQRWRFDDCEARSR